MNDKIKWWLNGIGAIIFLALAVVYLLIRPIVVQNLEPVIQDAVKEKINGTLVWRTMDLDPRYNLSFDFVELKDKEGKDVLKSANVTISWSAGALYNYLMHDGDLLNVVSGITMEEPMMTVRERKDGQWNVQELVKHSADESAGEFHGSVALKNGDLKVETQTGDIYTFEKVECDLTRGEDEKILTVKVAAPTEQILQYLEKQVITRENPYTTPVLKTVIQDSYSRLIAPSVEREIRSELTDKAQEGAIRVFGKNLEQLLMQPPIAGKVVLGWDPAFRTGCKLAVVDSTGKVLDTVVIFPTAPQNKVAESKKILKDLICKYGISLISVGNGTASRESEQIIVELLKELKEQVQYVIVNEAGASVYSASKLATEEFPNFDVGQRSAVSIARRLQDPLAELVKIDPKSIGVGQYQHDMNQKNLGEALGGVVEDCVNKVGVDLNTASASLLEYVSGINKTLAKNIVAYREENGAFKNRKQLLKVAKLGPKAFEQCAGFMRITGGDNPLDGTSVHPESYEAAGKLLEKLGYAGEQLSHGGLNGISKKIVDYKKMAQEMGIGEITLRDIAAELEKPARDPRDEMPRPVLRSDIMEMKDLKPGMVLKGTVRNVIDFGAFVDIGVHQDGLVHISQMTDRYIKHPLEAVSVGDVVDVKILSVDMDKKRISLTMKGVKDGN